jgi:MoaA/NifB/PqqE/SkfB family radical SAM enzyme
MKRLNEINLTAPISVEILLTQQCNLKCKHCLFDCGPNKKKRLSLKKIKNIICQLSKMKVFTVGLNGGEPLMLKEELYEIINYIKKKNLDFILTTNGTLLDPKFIKFISKKKPLCVRISLDFPTPSRHNSFRGSSNAFQKTIKNIKKCVKEKIETVLLVSLSKKI